jgi:hypothetical protein
MEGPHQLAVTDVIRANVAWRRHVTFACRASDDDQILKDLTGSIRLDVPDRRRIAAIDADSQVHIAVCAERHD